VPRLLGLRYLVTLYIAVLGAQLFAYMFDLNNTLLPPGGVSWAAYYLNPFFGPKTLYGAILVLPLAAFLVSVPWRDLSFRDALNHWTPAMFGVMAVARLGCLLQGCCYGVRSDAFGIRFPHGSVVYYAHVGEGLISEGTSSLPVVPTQALSALALFVLSLWAFRAVVQGRKHVFAHGVAMYSAFRFAVEFLRDDPARNAYGALSTSQWVAIAVLTTYGLWLASRRARRLTNASFASQP
jgi:phosphatidylglycerol:prolipoprotein diacylglycerol transferase